MNKPMASHTTIAPVIMGAIDLPERLARQVLDDTQAVAERAAPPWQISAFSYGIAIALAVLAWRTGIVTAAIRGITDSWTVSFALSPSSPPLAAADLAAATRRINTIRHAIIAGSPFLIGIIANEATRLLSKILTNMLFATARQAGSAAAALRDPLWAALGLRFSLATAEAKEWTLAAIADLRIPIREGTPNIDIDDRELARQLMAAKGGRMTEQIARYAVATRLMQHANNHTRHKALRLFCHTGQHE